MRCSFVRSIAVALILVSGAAASAQSLADVARREEERRKAVGEGRQGLYERPTASGATSERAAPGGVWRGGTGEARGACPGCTSRRRCEACRPGNRRRCGTNDGGWVAEARGRGARSVVAFADPRRCTAKSNQRVDDRLREPRRSGAAQRHLRRSPEGPRRARSREEGDRGAPKGHHHDPGRSTTRRRSRRLDPVRVVVLSSPSRRRQRFASRHAAPRTRDAGARGRRSARRA